MKIKIIFFEFVTIFILTSCANSLEKITKQTESIDTLITTNNISTFTNTSTYTKTYTVTNTPTFTPTPIKQAITIDGFGHYFCVITGKGGVKCWGIIPEMGMSNVPVDIPGFGNENISIAAGGNHLCVLDNNGGVKCLGENNYGQLGNGNTINSSIPVDVIGLSSGVTSISAGAYHTCVILYGGSVQCWGDNESGQLGKITTARYYSKPANVNRLDKDVVHLSSGHYHNCVVMKNGIAKCWGSNSYGQLGDGTNSYSKVSPITVIGLSNNVISIFTGGSDTCSIMVSGEAKCWGYYAGGYAGKMSLIPIGIEKVDEDMASFSLGSARRCGLLKNGSIRCWGSGPLGDGTNKDSFSDPVEITELNNKVSIVIVGGHTTCVILLDGGVKCWGDNRNGQVGDGTNDIRMSPVDVICLDIANTSGSHITNTPELGTTDTSSRHFENGEDIHFSYIPPEGWEIQKNPGDIFSFWRKKCGELYCILRFDYFQGINSAKDAVLYLQNRYEDTTSISQSSFQTDANLESQKITFQYESENLGLIQVIGYCFREDNSIVCASYVRLANKCEELDSDIDICMKTFKFEK